MTEPCEHCNCNRSRRPTDDPADCGRHASMLEHNLEAIRAFHEELERHPIRISRGFIPFKADDDD